MNKLEKALQKARQERSENLTAVANDYILRPIETGNKLSDIVLPHARRVLQLKEDTLERRRILAHRTRNRKADIFRMLRTQILQVMEQAGYSTLAITSPHYGDGKTTVAMNLAVSMAQDPKRTVLLADLDLRKPGVTSYLGIGTALGISDHLMDGRPIQDCMLRTSFDRLSILPSGKAVDNSSEILGSVKMAALANELKSRYRERIVIYDMPPILAQDDPIALLPSVDAVLLIVNEGVTKVDDIRRSMHALSRANVIGTVLNDSGKRTVFGRA
ncbi:MAG TPA: CpsD/CapB family tyrosine-protein kinase [Rickettsiales bacterium]|nr:CpsD/CapB family tyrosine-protein kinase [Rickettsiales bacterium]